MNAILLTLITGYLMILPFGQLLRVPTPFPEITLHAGDMVVGIIYLIWLGGIIVCKNSKKFPSPLPKPLVVFVIIALVSFIFSAVNTPIKETLVSGLYLLRWVAYASLFIITLRLSKIKNYSLKIEKTLLFSITLVALFGIIQYLIFPNLKPLFKFGWDEHYYRLASTFLDPGYTGIVLLMGLIISVIPLLTKEGLGVVFLKDNKNNRALRLIITSLLYSSLALTYSRASYLALIGTSVVWLWFKRSARWALIIGFIFLITWLLLPHPVGEGGNLTRTSTINFRFINYQHALQLIKERPILGVGFNRLRYVQRDHGFLSADEWQTSHSASGIDNSWLFVFVTTGIIGFTSYLWIWISIFKSIWLTGQLNKITLKQKNNKLLITNYQLPTILTLVSLVIHSQFHNTLFYPPVMGITWIILGLALASKNQPYPLKSKIQSY